MKSKILSLILCAFIFSSFSFAASQPATARNVCHANEVNEVIGLSPEMCNLGSEWKDLVATGTYAEVYQAVLSCKRTKPFFYTNMPWLLLRSPRIEVRRVAFTIQEDLAGQIIRQVSDGKDQTPYKMVLTESAKHPAVYGDHVIANVEQVIRNAGSNQSMDQYLEQAEAYTPELCLIFADLGCAAALKDAFKLSHVISLYNKSIDMQISVTMVDETKHLFEESHFKQGLAIAALRISDLAQQALKGTPPATHLLDDLVSSFEEAGYDQRSALKLSFNFLSFYGTRGASMAAAIDLVTPENQSVMLSSMMIAASLGILDSATLQTTHPYSLPAQMTTNCEYGSPYHFWMPAALAWQLVAKGHSPHSSMIAAHILGVGYEALASTVSRKPWAPLTIPSKSISNNGVRVNIAMNDAGAKFGSEIAAGKHTTSVNLDHRIELLVNSPADLAPLTEAQAAKLFETKYLFILRWLLIFTPNLGF